MTTKKFNKFEYAALADPGKAGIAGVHYQDVFETPLGHAFVLVADHHAEDGSSELCEIALERIRYYMNHDAEEIREEITTNALIYTSGYIYQHYNKDAPKPGKGLSCLCVLYGDDQIHYSWVGDVGLYLFTGKRMHWLSWMDQRNSGSTAGNSEEAQKQVLLGQQTIIEPASNCDAPLKPVNGDKLILVSGTVGKCIHTKETKRILKDSMPLQTKVNRILRHADHDRAQQSGALIILRFHAISNKERIISADAKMQTSVQPEKKDDMAGKKTKTAQKKMPVSMLGLILWILGFLAIAYFVYDLFIYDPHPPVSIEVPQPEAGPDETINIPEEVAEEVADADLPAALPDDITYTVRSGDTWGRVYSQFMVCSWFVINHPPNTGRFGSQGSLIAGQRLQIPVRYSGDAQLNPNYYNEFTADKVGDGCRNVDRNFLEAFEDRLGQ